MTASICAHCSMLAPLQHALKCLQPVGFAGRFVPAEPVDARKAHRNTGLVTCRTLQSLERHFQYKSKIGLVRDFAHRSEAIDSISAHESVDLEQLFVGKAEIGFSNGNQLFAGLALVP